MYFRGLVLSGGEGVFTVRPETEMLVEHVEELAHSGALPDGEWVDLCTGSAAIALALSTETGHQVTAVEIDSDAFAYAERNLARYPKARLRLVRGDGNCPGHYPRPQWKNRIGRDKPALCAGSGSADTN